MSANKSVSAAFTSGASDYDTASAAINAIYNKNASFFGTKSGGITAGTDATGTYYIQFFTNGTGLMAYTDGYMYFYSGGKWNPFGVKWK
jgi:hypothetical protein